MVSLLNEKFFTQPTTLESVSGTECDSRFLKPLGPLDTLYCVLRPFQAHVESAAGVPAFVATGRATPYLSQETVQSLLKKGFIEVVQ